MVGRICRNRYKKWKDSMHEVSVERKSKYLFMDGCCFSEFLLCF